ncbi:alpha/beta hydrolase [Kutzneria sp. NPDC052558]|uniref:alpha/beta hydrolase n=1 Tax=Kutzneria sp. NPDC052558 TaxID=3364121 RepID=UPI0037C67A38
MRSQLGIAAVVAAVLCGLVATAAPAQAGVATRYATQQLNWRQCAADEVNLPAGADPTKLLAGLQCATFTTPRDWDHPGQGPDLTIAVSRLAATGTATASLITNPGGPGGAGRFFPVALTGQAALREHQDVIGMDARGTGKSTTVDCGEDGSSFAKLDPQNRDPGNLNKILDGIAGFARACQQHAGALLPYIDTYQTVRDIDLLRTLLGRPTINWVGYSAGTWMGAHYAQTFPQHTGRFVLDSNTEFTGTWQDSFGLQPIGIERRWREDLVPWLAKYDADYHLGATADAVYATYQSIRAALGRTPLDLGGGVTYGPFDLDLAILAATEATGEWKALAATVGNARTATDPAASEQARAAARAAIKAVIPPVDSNAGPQVATEYAVRCNDTRYVGGDRASLIRLSQRYIDAGLPLWGAAQLEQPCAFWPSHPKPLPTVNGKGVPPVLMVQGERDPVTPIEGARAAHARFQNSRLITVTGAGNHGQYCLDQNPALDAIVDNYLVNGVVPADQSIPGSPLPTP